VEESQTTARETVRVLAALSDENRFRIVSLLAGEEGELTCGAISKALELSPSLLSHHLSILAEAGLIGRRKNGLWTMNALERCVIERQLASLVSLIGRNGNGSGADGDTDGQTHGRRDGDTGAIPAETAEAPRPTQTSDDGVIAGS
jgi:ArsR family transcriptional regulator, arsenate/arsenite/antimonite-responsive transcriptional repressor